MTNVDSERSTAPAGEAATVLVATGLRKSYHRGIWPVRRTQPVLRGVDLGGVFLAFLLPFLDLGIAQSPMLHPEPTTLSRFMPGYGGSRLLIDAALTRGFDEAVPLVIGLAWLAALALAVALIYRHATAPSRFKTSARVTFPRGIQPMRADPGACPGRRR
jgi:hypothetical protein